MPSSVTNTRAVYPSPLDAIVLAGTDDNPRRMIHGQNKAFLELDGKTLVRRVTEALVAAGSVGGIFVVGPSERLRQALDGLDGPVTIVEQAGQMLANAWQAIGASEARHRERHGQDDDRRPLLFLSSDLPLISAAAVDDFVARCAAIDAQTGVAHGMLTGVVEEASLKRYYPGDGRSGIVRPYVHFADCRLRLANIYVGRPRQLAHEQFLQTGFDHRKAEKWKNVMALAGLFLGQAGGWQAAWITLRLQATLLAAGTEGALYRRLRRGNSVERIERACSRVLGGPVRIVVSPYGGLSLDADNEEDFRVLAEHFREWSDPDPAGS